MKKDKLLLRCSSIIIATIVPLYLLIGKELIMSPHVPMAFICLLLLIAQCIMFIGFVLYEEATITMSRSEYKELIEFVSEEVRRQKRLEK